MVGVAVAAEAPPEHSERHCSVLFRSVCVCECEGCQCKTTTATTATFALFPMHCVLFRARLPCASSTSSPASSGYAGVVAVAGVAVVVAAAALAGATQSCRSCQAEPGKTDSLVLLWLTVKSAARCRLISADERAAWLAALLAVLLACRCAHRRPANTIKCGPSS